MIGIHWFIDVLVYQDIRNKENHPLCEWFWFFQVQLMPVDQAL